MFRQGRFQLPCLLNVDRLRADGAVGAQGRKVCDISFVVTGNGDEQPAGFFDAVGGQAL